jgi:hypothetical protein
MGITEDVHDVLRLNSSERPREEGDVERPPRRADGLCDAEFDAPCQGHRARAARLANLDALRVDPPHVCRVLRVQKGEAPVAATHLEHTFAPDVDEFANRVQLEPIDMHRATLPRATASLDALRPTTCGQAAP